MGNRAILILSGAATAVLAPLTALAADSSFFGPIIPQAGECLCEGSAMDWGCVTIVTQAVLSTVISVGIVVVVFYIGWAGFSLITSGANAGARTKAKNRMLNAVLGLVVVLTAFLMVDTVMKVLYNPDAPFEGGTFGFWNEIFVGDGDNFCVKKNENPGFLNNGSLGDPTGGDDDGGGSAPSGPLNPGTNTSTVGITPGSGTCAPEVISKAAAAGGYSLTSAQATTFSCIAKFESSCGSRITGAKTEQGKPTTANGMFQIILGYKDNCHSLNLPVCSTAAKRAGYPVSGNLNCAAAFSGGKPRPGKEKEAAACKAAAANVDCNTSAAACLLKNNPSFSDWTSDSRATKQKACIAKYNT
ncbi:MAG: hypothetical protein AB203_00165 [Parcubacteria bacterium C7867-008]|nr:MAG: hypothetical protein AB203_00165 [Parcubacteria bacterium C7867-008]